LSAAAPATVAERPEETSAKSAGPAEVILGDRYRILPDNRLPEFDIPGTQAFVVRDLKSPSALLFARVCAPDVFPRTTTILQIRALRDLKAMRALGWGSVDWPATGDHRAVTVFERPENPPLMPSYKAEIQPLAVDVLIKKVLGQAAIAIGHMWQRGQTHRAVRPDNMYLPANGEGELLMGDCVSTPPGWGQPAALETIELGMTPKHARGPGNIADDIYALGATLLCLAVGRCPIATLSDEHVIEAKLRQGSFTAILGEGRTPPGLREPLRGMLEDDPNQRWRLDDIEQWLGGQISRSGKPIGGDRAERPFEFAGQQYRGYRELAHAFGKHPQQAVPAIRGKTFDAWMRRGMADADLGDAVAGIIAKATGADAEARLVAQVCLAIDPLGPLRYGPLTVMASGLGMVLAHAVLARSQDAIHHVVEVLTKGLAGEWCESRGRAAHEDLSFLAKLFKRAAQHLKHAGPGYGVERCLYELASDVPCLSAVLKNHHVMSLGELLPTLEAIVEKRGGLPALVDRHIAGFIAARCKANLDYILGEIENARDGERGSAGSIKATVGMVRLLAQVQSETTAAPVPRLAAWLVGEVEPVLETIKSRVLRDKVKKKFEQLARAGNLVEIATIIQNEGLFKRDAAAFAAAQREYLAATSQIKELDSADFQEKTRRTGWRLASKLSFLIACASISVVLLW
jgi:hypothetical protein